MRQWGWVALFVLGLATLGLATPADTFPRVSDPMVITSNPGGRVGDFVRGWRAVERAGVRVVIKRECTSSCTIVLGMVPNDRVCVYPGARFGFHLLARQEPNGRMVQEPALTAQFVREFYPGPVREWIKRHGPLQQRPIYMTGRELMAAGIYRQCPTVG